MAHAHATESVVTLLIEPTFVPAPEGEDAWPVAGGAIAVIVAVLSLVGLLIPAVPRTRGRNWLDIARPVVAVGVMTGACWVLLLTMQYQDREIPGVAGWLLLGGGAAALLVSMVDARRRWDRATVDSRQQAEERQERIRAASGSALAR